MNCFIQGIIHGPNKLGPWISILPFDSIPYRVRYFCLLIGQQWKTSSMTFLFAPRTNSWLTQRYENAMKYRENIGIAAFRLISDRHKLQHSDWGRWPFRYPLTYPESLKRFEKILLPKRGGYYFWGFSDFEKKFRYLPVFRFFSNFTERVSGVSTFENRNKNWG